MDPLSPQSTNQPFIDSSSSPSQSTNQPINQSTGDRHGITIAALAIFILLSLATVVFLYYQNQQLKNMLASYQTPVATPTPTATADPTANWKTYTNNKYQFEFKYPNNLETLSQSEGGTSGPLTGGPIFITAFADKSTIAQGTDKPFDGLSIDIVDTKGSFDTYVSNEFKAEKLTPRGISNSTIQELNIGTQNWYIDSEPSIRRYFLKSGNTVVAISVSHFSPNFLATVDQILSTFKFTGSTASPSAKPVACTQEAKLCPNGSYVSRTGPNCEFAACPTP